MKLSVESNSRMMRYVEQAEISVTWIHVHCPPFHSLTLRFKRVPMKIAASRSIVKSNDLEVTRCFRGHPSNSENVRWQSTSQRAPLVNGHHDSTGTLRSMNQGIDSGNTRIEFPRKTETQFRCAIKVDLGTLTFLRGL